MRQVNPHPVRLRELYEDDQASGHVATSPHVASWMLSSLLRLKPGPADRSSRQAQLAVYELLQDRQRLELLSDPEVPRTSGETPRMACVHVGLKAGHDYVDHCGRAGLLP